VLTRRENEILFGGEQGPQRDLTEEPGVSKPCFHLLREIPGYSASSASSSTQGTIDAVFISTIVKMLVPEATYQVSFG